MRRYQARPRWELERSLRRQALRRGVLVGIGGVVLLLVAWGFLVALLGLA
jgi:heme O synthase-like polyprenyltransferase